MSRAFYNLAVFFCGLVSVLSFYRTFIFMRLGPLIPNMSGLPRWLLFEFVVNLVLTAIILWYFHLRKYRGASYALAATTTASIIHLFLFYRLLTIRDVGLSYVIASVSLLVCGLVYGVVLSFGKTRQQRWLRLTGVLMILANCWGIMTLAVALMSLDARLDGTVQNLELAGNLLGSLLPLVLGMNFLQERSNAPAHSEPETVTAVLNLFALGGCLMFLVFGVSLFNESTAVRTNPDNVSEQVKAFALKFEPAFFVSQQGDTLRYRLMPPLNADSLKTYPLVVCLHGSSGCGRDNYKQVVSSWPSSVLSSDENRKKYPAYLFVPQCPRGSGWGGVDEFPSVDSLVMLALNSLLSEKSIDRNRIYVSGNSLGGYGSWHLIAHYPHVFAAAIPISGVGDVKFASAMNAVPVWAFHGDRDVLVPVSGSRDVVSAMKAAGGTPRYTEYEGEGHNIWQKVTETPELLDWLFSQQKNSSDSVKISFN
jgi:predicted esterase